MTKPADSEQIAKARRISEIAEREKLARKVVQAQVDTHHWADTYLEDIPFLLLELASERQAVIEDCAKIAEDPANREPGWSLSTQRMIARAIRSME